MLALVVHFEGESDDFADIQNQALNYEWKDTDEPYNPSKKYYNTQDLEFNSSVDSDPNSILSSQLIKDIVGATGPNAGQPGPKGDKGDKGDDGDDGLYYDSVVGLYDDPDVTPNNPSPYKSYSLKFTSGNGLPDLHLKQDLMGPAVDEATLIDIINNIELPVPDPGDDWKGPYVHRGSESGEFENINEDIFGQKTICNRLAFRPEGENDKDRLIDFPADMSLYTKGNVTIGGGNTLDFIRVFSRKSGSSATNSISMGIRSVGNAAAVGIKVEKPQAVLEAKGNIRTGSLTAVGSNYFDSDTPITSWKHCTYGTEGIDWNKLPNNVFEFGLAATSVGKVRFHKNVEIYKSRLTIDGQNTGFFKIMPSTMTINDSGVNFSLVYNAANGIVSRRPVTRSTALVVSSSPITTMGNSISVDTGLEVIKALKPRAIVHEGVQDIGFDRDEIPASTRANIESTKDGEAYEASLNSIVSMLVLSVQKLEQRISALES